MASKRVKSGAAQCPECCEHGVALFWFCAWCSEIEEFGTSDFGVWGSEMVMPCEHTASSRRREPASKAS